MKAFLKNYRQSPRKVRLVAGLIKGKRVADALVELDHLSKRAASPVRKLIISAVSNAKQAGVSEENLFIENIVVNKGIVLKRIRPRARGSAFRINKRTSHVTLTLNEKGSKQKVVNTKEAEVEKSDDTKEKVVKSKKETKSVTKKSKTTTKKSKE